MRECAWRQRLKRWIPVAVTVLLIGAVFVFSSQPGEDSGKASGKVLAVLQWMLGGRISEERLDAVHGVVRTCAHFTLYMLLSASACWSCIVWKDLAEVWMADTGRGILRRLYALLPVLLCGVVAVLDEWNQSFVPGRTSDWRDVLVDLLGSLTAWCVINAVRRVLRRRT